MKRLNAIKPDASRNAMRVPPFLHYNPPVYFWIAEYNDGQALPQFDVESGKENLFKDIDQSKLKRFGWYPFTLEFAEKIGEAGVVVRVLPLPHHVLELKSNQRLIAKREQEIKNYSFHRCLKCGFTWQWGEFKEPVLPVSKEAHVDAVVQNDKEVKYVSPICPSCGAFNVWICPDCKRLLSYNKERQLYCYGGCGKVYPKAIVKERGSVRSTKYLLGWQETVMGRNVQSVMWIDEEGNATTK